MFSRRRAPHPVAARDSLEDQTAPPYEPEAWYSCLLYSFCCCIAEDPYSLAQLDGV
jgi:hypothetical protein